ncbi:MAG TPA: hypothetical protein VEJ84_19920 [Acidimicrobiales bacterium]|nr:hypothetical protein [Acidimicrobiales bacterium]
MTVVPGDQLLVASVSTWRDALFYGLVFTHAVAALVGFGSIGFAGTYASRAFLPPEPYLPPAVDQLSDGPLSGDEDVSPADDLAPDEAQGVGGPVRGAVANVIEGSQGGPALASSVRPQVGQGTATEVADEDAEFEELRRYFRKPAQLWRALLLVPFLGLGALAADPNGGGLDQTWALGALVVWLAATLVAASLVLPGLYQLRTMVLQPAPLDATAAGREAERIRFARARALAARGAAGCDVLFFVALALMVWRP